MNVSFVGQTATRYLPNPFNYINDNVVISKNTKLYYESTERAMYDFMKANVRNWFNDSFKSKMTAKYYLTNNNMIINRDDTLIKSIFGEGFEAADIFPASKVALTILTLCIYLINCGSPIELIYTYIADYLIYIHLLNSWCGV